jgi:molecular chaperone HtpG
MPIPIKFGTKKEALPKPEDAGDDYKTEYIDVDNILSTIQIQLGPNNQVNF